MDKLPTWLKKLDAALEALPAPADPMTLSQLDGYLTGILVCPETILPSEWMPDVWGLEDEDEPVFEDEKQFRSIFELVMKYYNTICLDLMRPGDQFAPIYDIHNETGEILPFFWLTGFSRALSLRPVSWLEIAEGEDEDAATALSILMALASAGEADVGFSDEEFDELLNQAPDMIPYCVQRLNDWRQRNVFHSPVAGIKAGRNEPCPCGSGKKYKKCCGLS